MTSKERIITAMKGGIADHVPVSPDISVMVPDKLTGKPLYEIHLDGREHSGWTSATHGEAYIDAIKYFGMDGFYMYGGLKQIKPEGLPGFDSKIKIYRDPLVQKTAEISVGDITLIGGLEKSYYIVKQGSNIATIVKKKTYKNQFKQLFGDCPELIESYQGKKPDWDDFPAHVFIYDQINKSNRID